MAAKDTIDQLKAHIERLRRDSVDVVATASRIVFEGVQKLAEQELQALNDYYKNAVGAMKTARSGNTGPKDLAAQQLDLLQDTVQRVISHARESLSIISSTRAELARLLGTTESALDTKALTKVTAPAQKAMEDVKKVAAKAQATAAKTAKDMKRTLDKELAFAEKKGKAAVKQTEAKARAVGKEVSKAVKSKLNLVLDIAPPAAVKKAVSARPSPESRAARAASKAKKTVRKSQG